jgi:thymidylate synthase (FAD)
VTLIELSSTIKVELVDHMGSDDSVLAAMLVSTKSDGTVSSMSSSAAAGRINYLMKNRHGTPFEHGSMTFRVEAPIFVFREWHRHRAGWSYNEMSGRYTELPPRFYVPPYSRTQTGKPGHYVYERGTALQDNFMFAGFHASYSHAWDLYQNLLQEGIAKEMARMVLPVAIYSQMYATCNPRSLMHFLSLRTTDTNSSYPSYPMAEIEEAARQMELEFGALFPMTYQSFVQNGRVAP